MHLAMSASSPGSLHYLSTERVLDEARNPTSTACITALHSTEVGSLRPLVFMVVWDASNEITRIERHSITGYEEFTGKVMLLLEGYERPESVLGQGLVDLVSRAGLFS